MDKNQLLKCSIKDLAEFGAPIENFFSSKGLKKYSGSLFFGDWLSGLSDEFLFDIGMDRGQIIRQLEQLVDKLQTMESEKQTCLDSIAIIGGKNKSGNPENARVILRPGQVICVVGPTGSGKSRLLADIECFAQGDTPTGRKISVNGKNAKNFNISGKLVAQISQNMNFVVDLSVSDFIAMHARSRLVADVKGMVKDVINCANRLAGEKFNSSVSLAQLSGGQSRTLMIADAALLSSSPIVLIDEIENAGIDRKESLKLLVKKEKIVLISTHDPLLALMGSCRIVMENGGISRIIESSSKEKENLRQLECFDEKISKIRTRIRHGEEIEENLML
jgi:ABC-type lipoprotein export system ATPase subunit